MAGPPVVSQGHLTTVKWGATILGSLANISQYWQVYKETYQIGASKEEIGNYNVELKKNNTLIHVIGGLALGISKEVSMLLKKHKTVRGVILDSYGGYIYEGRELSKLIFTYGLDTYSLNGCYSACTTAFIAGKNRFLSRETNLVFHQYYMVDKNLGIFVDMKKEQEEDLRIFKRQGVASEFLKRLFNTPHDDFWYPTIEEMLDAHVITGIANQSDLIPITYGDSVNEFSEALLSISAFKIIQKYDPEAYKRIIAALENQLRKGASQIELQGEVATYIKTIGTRMMSQSSNEALISFAKLLVDMLQKLEQKDPILCLKALNPKKYGSFSITDYFPKEEVIPLLDVFSSIIVDAYEMKNPPVDAKAAELILQRVITKLGRYAYYLEPSSLQNLEQYKLHCEATIKFYELILSEDKNTAGNALRFAFSE